MFKLQFGFKSYYLGLDHIPSLWCVRGAVGLAIVGWLAKVGYIFAQAKVLCVFVVIGVEVVALINVLLVLGQPHFLDHDRYVASVVANHQLSQPEDNQGSMLSKAYKNTAFSEKKNFENRSTNTEVMATLVSLGVCSQRECFGL